MENLIFIYDTSITKIEPHFRIMSEPCYKGCSKINPALADACSKVVDYANKCPTRKRVMGEIK